ncbi:MAG: 16S rRNA pseudouridine(516) synthase [Lachnospiraceae bacterium]|nr:16S rRNA pseudouridine(516) synthase [Lachnospiraceae bacterium]
MKNIRLDKYLADMGVGTRTEVKGIIKKGAVVVSDKIIKDPGYKVSIEDSIICNGQNVVYESFEYLMLNKPAGYITATEDKKEKTIMSLIKSKRNDLFPVGRLDKDTEGLLLITNDGDMAHRLLSPKKHIAKKYYVELEKVIENDYIKSFEAGIVLKDGTKTRPGKLEVIDNNTVYLTIFEGKFHQVKRMFEALDNKVKYLKRVSMGTLILDKTLELGKFRPLTEDELEKLRRHIDGN